MAHFKNGFSMAYPMIPEDFFSQVADTHPPYDGNSTEA